MKSLLQYYLFFLALTLPIIGLAQSDQIKVKKVPFVNNSDNTIHQILQDSTGLLWFMSFDKMYISDGEKVSPFPMPFESNRDRVIHSMMNFTNQNGNFFLGGDSMRIFNPYSRDIIESIGLDAKYSMRNTKPTLWMFLKGEKNDLWAVITTHAIDENNRLVKGNSIIHSENGAPFQKVVNAPFFLYSQSIVARGKELYLSTNDTVFQYTSKGELVKTYTFPSLKSIPYTTKNQVAADGTIRFIHFLKNEKTGKFDRAIYELKPNESEFTVHPFPEMNGIEFHRCDEVGDFFWLKGYGMSLHRVSIRNKTVTDYSKIILQQHPDIFYDDATFNEIFEDATGTIWASTSNKWLLKIESTAGPFFKTSRIEDRFPIQLSQLIYYDSKKDTIVHTYDNLPQLSTLHVYPNHLYFNLDVFVPDFRDAEQNTYTWRLEGYDANWVKPNTNNTIHYEKLPVGKYTLRIRGGITEDYYESSEKQIQVIVHQSLYKSWWAWSLYLITFFSLVYVVYQIQVSRQLKKIEANRLKEMNMLKSRLYTNITHEFRTPLTVIMGITNNIEGHQKEKDLIHRNSKTLLQLINQLLDLSKLDSGTLKIDEIQADIIQYFRYLTESFYSMANEKHIRLTFYPEIKELVMDYDEVKIQHIVYNLLTNAIKFTMKSGEIILHVKKIEKNNSDWLQLKISDTGIGISKENLPKIFDRFFQGDGSSTRQEAGTGIGLTLTKELVEMLGGQIAVESKLGTGTVFIILLPIKLSNNTIKRKQSHQNLDSKVIPSTNYLKEKLQPFLNTNLLQFHDKKPALLIIEDNKDIVTYINGLLNNKYQIKIARNGQEGIDKALAFVPDVIISDVMMPQKDGYEVCQYLKNDERTSHIPIILLTAKATTSDRIEGLKGGADAYLIKPFNKEELLIRLKKLIEVRKALQKRYSETIRILKPQKPKTEPTLEDVFLQKLIKVILDRLDDPDLAVVHLCRVAKLSNTQVNRKLKALTGKTPSQFIRFIRLQKAMELLQTTDLNISEVAYEVGFNNPNYFSRSFSEEFGFPPSTIRK